VFSVAFFVSDAQPQRYRVVLWGFKIAILLLIALTNDLRAQSVAAEPAGKCYALLMSGKPGMPIYERRFHDWIKRFRVHLVSKGVAKENIVTYSSDNVIRFEDGMLSFLADRQEILAAIEGFSKKVRPQDQFVVVILGHGSRSDANPTLVLRGPDLDAETLAKSLATIQSKNQVILNFTSTSGDFLKALAKPNRVNITATTEGENAEPVLPEFFLRKLEKGEDVTLLDAYNHATHQTALWIARQVGQDDGSWLVHGRESVEIFKKLFDGPEGEITAGGTRADGSRKLSEQSDASKPDETVPLVVPQDLKPNDASYWAGRRIVNEHAQLEDRGTDNPVTALTGETGYTPIKPDKKDAEGSLAAKVVLGRAELLTVREK